MNFFRLIPHAGPMLAATTLFLLPQTRLEAQDVTFKSGGEKAVLLELYSSEGCSSCPPAEAWLGRLKTSPKLWTEIFPAAFHVDYWDGLGWPDRFARPAYTQRQRNYAAVLGQDSVYTPEFIANGREWRGWFHGEQSPPAGQETHGNLTLQVREGGTSVSAIYASSAPGEAPALTLNVALLGVNIMNNVRAGENGGRLLEHDFVVLDFASKPLGRGPSFTSGPIELKSATDDPPGAIVAWISGPDGSIVQIAGGWLRPATASTAEGPATSPGP